jgi:hypothetical protein
VFHDDAQVSKSWGREMTNIIGQRRMAPRAFPNARSEPRVVGEIVVEISGFDAAGCFFTEHTSTANFSKNGCCFRVNAGLGPGALVALRSSSEADIPNRPVFYQVIWIEPLGPKLLGSGTLVGAARLLGESVRRNAFSASSVSYARKA